MSYIVCRSCHKDMPKREIPLCQACALDNGVTPGRTITILPEDWSPPATQALREAFLKVNIEEKDLLLVLEALAVEAEKIKKGKFSDNLFRNLLTKLQELNDEVYHLRNGYTRCGLCNCWDHAVNHHGDCRICARDQYA